LEDELRSLKEKLLGCVEEQIHKREEEVNGWMERCEGVEGECMWFVRALGSSVGSLGGGIGDLRKEGVLPRRWEMGCEYQEKLRQVCALFIIQQLFMPRSDPYLLFL
jgi:Ase1/PRC1/MAP65 family protein